jgi:hypothetical protein
MVFGGTPHRRRARVLWGKKSRGASDVLAKITRRLRELGCGRAGDTEEHRPSTPGLSLALIVLKVLLPKTPFPNQFPFRFTLQKKCRRPTLRECDSSCTSAAFCRGPVRPSAGCCRSPGSCRTVGDLVGIAEPVNVFWHINLLEPDNEKNSSIISEMNWKVCAY